MKKIFLISMCISTLVGCESEFDPKLELPKPPNFSEQYSEDALTNKQNPNDSYTTIYEGGTYTFIAHMKNPVKENTTISLSKDNLNGLVKEYNKFKKTEDYVLLPEKYYQFVEKELIKGEVFSEVELKIKDYENMEQGNYFLPMTVKIGNKVLMHPVIVRKDATYVPLSDANKKPMPPQGYSCPNRKEPMKMIAYVETNDWDIRNMGQFILKESKKPVFDIVILFAANMNYDARTGKRVLFFNDKLQPIVNDPDKYIKPLKDRGIKVLVDILPNHQGVGYWNFQNYEEALDFARECKQYTDKLGIDGWDIDEEYARYDKLPSKPQNMPESMLFFARAMKEVMPDKLLTLYDYGHGMRYHSEKVDEKGKTFKDYLDYSWANYGENHPSYVGVPNERYGKKSIEANWSLTERTVSFAANANVEECYGNLMIFNINGHHIKSKRAEKALSKATTLFYGEECVFEGIYHKGPKDK